MYLTKGFRLGRLTAGSSPVTPPAAAVQGERAYAIGSGLQDIDVTAAFAGGGAPTTYVPGVLPAWASFDAVARRLRIDTTGAVAGSISVTGSNAAGSSTAAFPVRVAAAPEIEAVSPPQLGEAVVGQQLSALFAPGVYTIAGGPVGGQTVAFTVGGTARAGSYVLVTGDVDAAIVASETVTASGAAPRVFTASRTVIAGAGPVNTAAPVLTMAVAAPGQVMTWTVGAWTGGSSPIYAHRVYRGAQLVAELTAASYTAVAEDALQALRVEVERTDSSGKAAAYSNTITLSAPAKPAAVTGAAAAGPASLTATLPADPASVAPIVNRTCRVTPNADLVAGDLSRATYLARQPAGATVTADLPLAATQYAVQWRASSANGPGSWSDKVLVTTTAETAATAPLAFDAASWTLANAPSAGSNQLALTITALPGNGGSPITAVEARINGGAWAALSGLTGTFALTVPPSALATVDLRAVNAVGAGAVGAAKTAIPGPITAGSITLTPTSRDRLLYDSGGARGLNAADVLFAGTGPNGAVIEARLVSLGDNGQGSTPWQDVGTIAGGVFSGRVQAPRSHRWYKRVCRIKGQAATEVESAADRRVGVGHYMALYQQSEHARAWSTAHDLIPHEVLTTSARARLDALRWNLKLTGPQIARTAMKRPGVDAAPAGVSFDTIAQTIAIAAGATVVLDGWDLYRYRSAGIWAASTSVHFRHCRIGRAPGQDFVNYPYDSYGICTATDCDFEGTGGGAGTGSAHWINQRNPGNPFFFERNRYWGHANDAVKLASGAIRGCYFDPPVTVDRDPIPYVAAGTKAAGTLVTQTSDTTHAHMWRAKRQVAAGVAPSWIRSASGDTIDWEWVNPHVDQITVPETGAPVEITGNNLSFRHDRRYYPVAGRQANGLNNLLRLGGTPGLALTQSVRVTGNLFDYLLDGNSTPTQVTGQELPGYVPPEFRHNIFATGAGTLPIYDYNVSANNVVWEDNRRGDGAVIATPLGATAGAATPDFEPDASDMVQMIWHDRSVAGAGGVQHKHLTLADAHTSAFSAAANALMAGRAGDKFVFVHHTVSGSNFDGIADEAVNTLRTWSQEAALHAYATDNGAVDSGVAAFCWWNAPAGYNNEYDKALIGLAFGIDSVTGAALSTTVPTVINSNRSILFQHNLSALYNWAGGKWRLAILGPHRFDIGGADETNATSNARLQQIQNCRASVRKIPANTVIPPVVLPLGLEPIDFINGQRSSVDAPSSSSSYAANGPFAQDLIHPNRYLADGQNRLWQQTAQAILQCMGLTSWRVPEIDSVTWSPTGDYVDLRCSFAQLTTLRLERGLPPIGAGGFTHRAAVAGLQINGVPAQKAEIVAGAIRLWYGAGTQTFMSGDVITLGAGGATGFLQYPDDFVDDYWLNTPVGRVDIPGLAVAAVRPMPAASVLANPLTRTSRGNVGGSTATVPDTFDTAQWSVAATGVSGQLRLTITSLPASNNAAITALSYRIGTGAAVALSAAVAGDYMINGLTDDVDVSLSVRATNSVGVAAWSAAKTGRPTGSVVSTFTTGVTGPYFVDAAQFGANTGQLHFRGRLSFAAPAAARNIAALSANMFKLDVVPGGGGNNLRISVTDSAGLQLLNNSAGGAVSFGAMVDIAASVDLVALYARVWLNGTQVINQTLAANSGSWTTSRVLSLLASNTGTVILPATVERLRFWKTATADGSQPAGAAYVDVVGPASAANAHAWKAPVGVDAT